MCRSYNVMSVKETGNLAARDACGVSRGWDDCCQHRDRQIGKQGDQSQSRVEGNEHHGEKSVGEQAQKAGLQCTETVWSRRARKDFLITGGHL